jgi:hypothetical protein
MEPLERQDRAQPGIEPVELGIVARSPIGKTPMR